jgi:hypothetical protein
MRKANFNPYAKPTPQGKLIATSDKFGNTGIKKMQGSTIHKFHYLPVGGAIPLGQELRFFENAGQVAFPFTNLMEGKLQVGEAMVLERIWFDLMTVDNNGVVTDIQSPLQATAPGFYAGLFSFFNANNQVIKPTGTIKQLPTFNRKSWNVDNEVVHLDTDITLQPLIEFVCVYRSPNFTVTVPQGTTVYLGCHIEGAGAILNPRANF